MGETLKINVTEVIEVSEQVGMKIPEEQKKFLYSLLDKFGERFLGCSLRGVDITVVPGIVTLKYEKEEK